MAKKATTKKTTKRTRKTAKPSGKAKTRSKPTKAKGGAKKKRGGTPRTDHGPQDTQYRVFHLPTGLKEGVQALNATTPESTMEKIFEGSVDTQLDGVVEMLAKAGVGNGGERKPIRVKISDATLAKLASASQQTGLDQRQLLCCCLVHSTRE
ncbi:MAG: hypothetical protein HUJ26_19045 [Planctomycetaceae bacterium]|nr:hypothetical protein [Planctomycetaceae bacterium]